MRRKADIWFRRSSLAALFFVSLAGGLAHARDAAFMDPSSGAGGVTDSIKVEPKSEIDTGESILNVARRTSLFFVNQTSLPIQVEKIAVNGDGNVSAEATNDDCSKQGSIPPLSRCSVEVSVTPSTPGAWTVDVLMTHNGPGRIARAKLTGKTTGSTAGSEKKDNGLALNTKDNSPVNFGDLEVGGKAVRSALMVNDSSDPISLYSIDVIEAGNGLTRLDQGCAVDMELKPGESCPVTLIWTPGSSGQISTDLIIRHSGRTGFAVIPIRGNAKATNIAGGMGQKITTSSDRITASVPPPPGAHELEKVTAGKIAPMSAEVLGATLVTSSGTLRLIGTVGNRAVLLMPDGTTGVENLNEEFSIGGNKAKIIAMTAKSLDLLLDGKKRTLSLEAAPELTSHAQTQSSTSQTISDPKAAMLPSPAVSGSMTATSSSAPAPSAPVPVPSIVMPTPTSGGQP